MMKPNSITPPHEAATSSLTGENSKAAKRQSVENVLQLIHAEHEIIKLLMLDLKSEHRPSVRTDLFRRLQVKLLCHVHAEEQVIFCHLSQFEDATEFVAGHRLGHQEIAAAATVLNSLNGDATSWCGLVNDFIDRVECYIVGTEDKLFGLITSYFSAEHRETLATQYRWAAYRHYREIQGVESPALHRVG